MMFAMLTATAVSAMTAYSSFYQRQTYIENEVLTQKQVLSLIRNNVSVQLYAFTNEQLQGILSIRNLLRENGQTLSHRIQEMQYSIEESYGVKFNQFPGSNDPRSSWSKNQREAERMFMRFLTFEKDSYNQVGSDIIVTYDLDVLLPPANEYIASGVSVSNRALLPTMLTRTNQYSAGVYISIFNREFSTVANLADNIALSTAWVRRHKSGYDIAPPEDRAFLNDGIYNPHRPVQTSSSQISSLLKQQSPGDDHESYQCCSSPIKDKHYSDASSDASASADGSASGSLVGAGGDSAGRDSAGAASGVASGVAASGGGSALTVANRDHDTVDTRPAGASAGAAVDDGGGVTDDEYSAGLRILEAANRRLQDNQREKERLRSLEPVSAMNVSDGYSKATYTGKSTVEEINRVREDLEAEGVFADAGKSDVLSTFYSKKHQGTPRSLPVLERSMYGDGVGRNYLSYLFKTESNSPFTYAIVQSVDGMLDQYHDVEGIILNRIQDHMDGLTNYMHGEAMILNADGKVLSSSSASPLFNMAPEVLMEYCNEQRLKQLEYKAQHGAAYDERFEENSSFMLDVNGETYLVNTLYFRPLGWYILNVVSLDMIVDPALSNAMALVLIGTIILIISLIVSAVLSNSIASRIIGLARQARIMSSTNISDFNAIQEITANIEVDGKDEIADLGQAFNRMGLSLNRNINLLMAANSQKNRMEGELNAAKDIQMGMLPGNFELPQSERLSNAALLYPAKEVGGDLYDIYRLDQEHIMYAIGDVSDKGVPAALFMSTTVTLARTCMCLGMSPNDAMTVLNGRLGERNPNMMFVTMFICVLNEKTGEVVACNAGHCPPVVIRRELIDGYISDGAHQSMQDRIMRMPASSANAAPAGGTSVPSATSDLAPQGSLSASPVLSSAGVSASSSYFGRLKVTSVEEMAEISGPAVGPMPDIEYTQYSFVLGKYDLLLLYTDGVSEAQNAEGGFFGVDRILDVARIAGNGSPEGLVTALDDEIVLYRGEYFQSDDITMLAVSRIGHGHGDTSGQGNVIISPQSDVPEYIRKHVQDNIIHETGMQSGQVDNLCEVHDIEPPDASRSSVADREAPASGSNTPAGSISRTEPQPSAPGEYL